MDSLNKNVIINNVGNLENFRFNPNINDYINRLSIYIKAVKTIRKFNKLNNYNIILANNIDVLFIYIITGLGFNNCKKTYIIEISDLKEFVFHNSFVSKFVRAFERLIYNFFVDKLIVTSKKYYDFHFSKFYKKDVFVLENKISSEDILIPNKTKINKVYSNKVVIGIVGLLLRKDEYIKLFETFKDSIDIEIHIHGTGPFKYIIEEYEKKYSNIKYLGEYNLFLDSYKIYNSIDILYVVYDNSLISQNNKLALPNKLYEAMYFKVPLICSKETYLSEIINDLEIGISIDYKIDGEIENAVSELVINRKTIIKNFKKIPSEKYIGDNDCLKLSDFILKNK
jgi:glycosyltransferase involved in cell wall biosynthesis